VTALSAVKETPRSRTAVKEASQNRRTTRGRTKPAGDQPSWWTAGDSNPRPPDCEPGALPAELAAHERWETDATRAAPGGQTDRTRATALGVVHNPRMSVASPALSQSVDASRPSAMGTPVASAVAWSSLAALAAGHFAVDCCTGIWPVYKTLAHLDLAKAGLIATLGSMIGNGLQLGFGLLADRGWRRRLLVLGVPLAGAATFVPWVHSYFFLFVLVLATYVGSAAFHPAGTGAAGTLSRTRTGAMVGIFLAGGYGGYALSQLLFSAIYVRSAALTPLLVLLPVLAATAIAVRVPPTASARHAGPPTRTLLRQHRGLLAALFVVQVFATAINLAVVFLLPDLMEARHAPRWMASGGAHFAFVLGACLSLLPAGYAADRWGARRALLVANLATGVLLAALLSRTSASLLDLLLVAGFGAFNGINNVVSVAEGNRTLPGQPSAVSAALMGMPWCIAAVAAVVAGLLADPARGGTPTHALAWLSLAIPITLVAGATVRSPRLSTCGPAADS
jgi:MFS transporter, FSR family, fosmidomycin resistance protein